MVLAGPWALLEWSLYGSISFLDLMFLKSGHGFSGSLRHWAQRVHYFAKYSTLTLVIA